jgi:hypothetical protein
MGSFVIFIKMINRLVFVLWNSEILVIDVFTELHRAWDPDD